MHTKKDIQKLSVVPQNSKNLTERKKTATKTSNMFKIVPRIGTCDAGFSSSKFRSSCLPFVVKQTTLSVFSQLLLSRTTVDSNFFHGPNEFEIMRVNCISLYYISLILDMLEVPFLLKGALMVVIVWQLELQLPVQSVHITTKVVSLNPPLGKVYSTQHYVINFVAYATNQSDCHDITEILLKVVLNNITP